MENVAVTRSNIGAKPQDISMVHHFFFVAYTELFGGRVICCYNICRRDERCYIYGSGRAFRGMNLKCRRPSLFQSVHICPFSLDHLCSTRQVCTYLCHLFPHAHYCWTYTFCLYERWALLSLGYYCNDPHFHATLGLVARLACNPSLLALVGLVCLLAVCVPIFQQSLFMPLHFISQKLFPLLDDMEIND